MKLIVGLGNPGSEYDRTRHNAGYLALDRVARRHAPGDVPRARFAGVAIEARLPADRCLLLKPTTYMNRSGQSVGQALRYYKLDPAEDLLVLVDDIALPSGTIRLRPSGGAGGHNGLADIERALGGSTYPRLRIGIDPSPPFMDQADYVLGRFTDEQWAAVDSALDRAADAVELFVAEGVTAAMNRFNERVRPAGPDRDNDGGDTPPIHPGWTTGPGSR